MSRQLPPAVLSASSGNVAAASAAATLSHDSSTFLYCTGFEITASGATAAAVVTATLTGLKGGTRSYTFVFPAGATVAAQPLVVSFDPPLPSTDVNTDIVLTLPSGGAGNTNAVVNLSGFRGGRQLT